MTIQKLTAFFKWCSIINGSLLLLSTLMMVFATDFIFDLQSLMFEISFTEFNTLWYSLLGLYEILFYIFNLAPYIALKIIGR